MQEYSIQKPLQGSSKEIVMLYYGKDLAAAKAIQASTRTVMKQVRLRDASVFDGVAEHCSKVMIMNDVFGRHRTAIEHVYGDLVDRKAAPIPAPKPEPVSVEKARETATQLALDPAYAAVRDHRISRDHHQQHHNRRNRN